MRQPDNYDKRIQRVVLTNDGISILKHLEEHLEQHNSYILEQIDLDTQEHIFSVLERLSWALDCTRDKL